MKKGGVIISVQKVSTSGWGGRTHWKPETRNRNRPT
jgi:hypothetical protein